jgi:NADPH-dependent glutamate synthase beta subunit-like oxidoreductase
VIRGQRTARRGQYAAIVTAPCISACPSNVDIPSYLEDVRMDRWNRAFETVVQDCPMPGTIGRVCVRHGVKVGEDIPLEKLVAQGYEAVFLAVGAPESSRMRCEGEDAGYRCFMTGVNFLAGAARGSNVLEGKRLVVIGGGNVAMDCVRTARSTIAPAPATPPPWPDWPGPSDRGP